ncbi:MAG: hypothetical protein ACD_65C00051G0007 [uncultured bacterium]|nr:MAG: hypothetical protein ACD_65C00051G0007 [uncultured bacterium]
MYGMSLIGFVLYVIISRIVFFVSLCFIPIRIVGITPSISVKPNIFSFPATAAVNNSRLLIMVPAPNDRSIGFGIFCSLNIVFKNNHPYMKKMVKLQPASSKYLVRLRIILKRPLIGLMLSKYGAKDSQFSAYSSRGLATTMPSDSSIWS